MKYIRVSFAKLITAILAILTGLFALLMVACVRLIGLFEQKNPRVSPKFYRAAISGIMNDTTNQEEKNFWENLTRIDPDEDL